MNKREKRLARNAEVRAANKKRLAALVGKPALRTVVMSPKGPYMTRRWHRVQMDELEAIWNDLRDRRLIYNGCTHVALVEKYGEVNLKHVSGHGWSKLVSQT